MYGSEETKAFCCNCKQLTLHKYTMFATKKETSPRKEGFVTRILLALMSSGASGDYKCQRCGTYLGTPDHLD